MVALLSAFSEGVVFLDAILTLLLQPPQWQIFGAGVTITFNTDDQLENCQWADDSA